MQARIRRGARFAKNADSQQEHQLPVPRCQHANAVAVAAAADAAAADAAAADAAAADAAAADAAAADAALAASPANCGMMYIKPTKKVDLLEKAAAS
jgi:hypothetical protein